jgi:divalent metal cation (Fe/Co/Zn/Cd) transporter
MANTNAHKMIVEAASRGTRANVWGIVASSVLVANKSIVGILGNSNALIVDGIDSTLDVMSSLVV